MSKGNHWCNWLTKRLKSAVLSVRRIFFTGVNRRLQTLFFPQFQVIRVLRGQGDQWDNRARSRGVTASFSLNGIGLVPEEAPDLYQENEELKVIIELWGE